VGERGGALADGTAKENGMKPMAWVGTLLAVLAGCTATDLPFDPPHEQVDGGRQESGTMPAARAVVQPAGPDQPVYVMLGSPDATQSAANAGAPVSPPHLRPRPVPTPQLMELPRTEQAPTSAGASMTLMANRCESALAPPSAQHAEPPPPKWEDVGGHLAAVQAPERSPALVGEDAADRIAGRIAESAARHRQAERLRAQADDSSGDAAKRDDHRATAEKRPVQASAPTDTVTSRAKRSEPADQNMLAMANSTEPSGGGNRARTVGEAAPASIPTPAAAAAKTAAPSPEEPSLDAESSTLASGVRLVNSKRISLNYALNNVGPSGVAEVELWSTRDGRLWQKHEGAHKGPPPYVVEMDDEDLYGFTLVVHSGAGLGKRPPAEGDSPQMWVEVDVTAPTVRLLGCETDKDSKERHMTILWRATDKNLAPKPITISYAASPEGPWTPVVRRIDNSGRYVWAIPADVPHHFLVRVEAKDLAGNVGMAQTPKALLDDTAQPTASIVGVEPTDK
jgi:hypothetical protein